MTARPTVLVVDDEEAIRKTLKLCLESSGYTAVLAPSGEAALAMARRQPPDVALVDLRLGGMDGLAVTRTLAEEAPGVAIVLMTAYATIDNAVEAMRAGASDYLAKPFNLKELLLRVGALARRARPAGAGEDVLAFAGNEVDFRKLVARNWRGDSVELTATEAKLLRLLASRPDTVVPRREIVSTLYGPGAPMTHRTLDNLVLALRKTFERNQGEPRHFLTVRGVGIRFVPS